MASASTGFMVKSIILLTLVIVLMGASMFLGKAVGRSVMAFTEDKIQETPGMNDSGNDTSEFVTEVLEGNRSSFGYDPANAGQIQFSREWADPEESELSTVAEEGNIVEITIHEPSLEGDDTGGTDLLDSGTDEDQGQEGSSAGSSIFELGDSSVYRIQVGMYGDNENAESVWRRLTQAGFDASVSTFADNGETKYRVWVGSYHLREEADSVAEQMRSLNFDAWVYQVE
ncbi:MAG TPA: SPOR domain-containing protein [bacterium]